VLQKLGVVEPVGFELEKAIDLPLSL
jgi:hypothetical protein